MIDRVVVVEDRPATLEWLVEVSRLAFPQAEVDTASSVAAGMSLLNEPVQLALLDLELPDGSGITLIKELKRLQPDAMPVAATMFDDDDHLFAALAAGAMGYVLKDHRQEELATMLREITVGRPPLSPAIAQRLLKSFQVTADRPPEDLSERETEVLVMISKGYKLQDVAQALAVTRNTIAYHVKNIYQKLQISSRAEAVNEAMRLGLIRQ